MAIPLEPIRLGESGAIRVRYSRGRSRRADAGKILVITYDGICRSEDDGRFMLAMGKAGEIAWEPDGLVIDLADLACEQCPEDLTSLLYLGEGAFGVENMPQAIIAGPRCEGVIAEFFDAINRDCKPEAISPYFHDLDAAIDYVEEEMESLRARFF